MEVVKLPQWFGPIPLAKTGFLDARVEERGTGDRFFPSDLNSADPLG